MRLTLIAPVLLCILAVSLHGQTFEKSYASQSAPNVSAAIDQTADGGYIVATRGQHDFIKLDAQGELIWGIQATNTTGDPTNGAGIIVLDDGTMIIGGGLEQSIGYLKKIDANAQVLWEYIVLGGDVEGITPGINGGFFVLNGNCNGCLQVSSYSASGAHYWSRYFHKMDAIGGTADGGVVVGGTTSGMHHVRKYDSYGDVVWEWTGTNDAVNGSNTILGIVEGDDGNIYASGSINENGFSPYVLVLDGSGNFVNDYSHSSGGHYNSIRNSGDGNFIVGGTRGGLPYMAKIDASANLLWDRKIHGYRAQHAAPTSDGGAVALVRDTNGGTKVTKTDAQGNVFNTFIAGSIVLDQEGDCQVQPSDLPGITTVIASSVLTGKKFYATTDANGDYLLDCEWSDYEISTSLPAQQEPCEPTIASMTATTQTLDIGDKVYKFNSDPTGIVQGHVYIDNNGNCEYDAGDTPLDCIQTPWAWEGQNFPIFYGETNEDGFFSFEAPAQEYYFPYGFSNNLWSANATTGCGWVEGYLTAYDTITLNWPLAPNFNTASYISGHVFIDENNNCEYESSELVSDNFAIGLVMAGSMDTLTVQPLPDGYYAAILEAGTYEVFAQFDGNNNWVSCETSITVASNATCQDAVDIPLQAATSCSDFTVSIATPLIRICETSTLFVNYQNVGASAASPQIKVVLDTSLAYQSSTIPYDAIVDDTLIFNIGEMAPLEIGNFSIQAFVDCEAVLGETHCVEAQISGPNDCEENTPLWDGSSVKITGACEGDILNLKIENIGGAAMTQELQYIVIEDNILLYQVPFQLNPGEFEELSFAPSGASILVQAEQSADHPNESMPARSFEGCGQNIQGGFSLGYITQYPQDDFDASVSIFCLENVNSYDPNDKQGFPRGISDAHFIQSNVPIEYMIRFQNTGTAPAINVNILDAISPLLDEQTLRPGAASHPYTYSISQDNIASFYFENINLPDSSANFEASQGFITFTIDQQLDNPTGSEIFNSAEIIFDQNEPIITNVTAHRIPHPTLTGVEEFDICEGIWPPDSTITETISYLFFDSLITYVPNIFPNYEINVSLNLMEGEEYEGNIYYSDTTFTESLLTQVGCDSNIITEISILTSVDYQLLNQLSIAPNPTTGELFLSGLPLSSADDFSIRLIDQLGRVLTKHRLSGDAATIDLTALPAGVYFLELNLGDARRLERVLKL